MRTVSFSQPEVCSLLDRDFVCFHTSTEGDPTAGQSIRHSPNDPAGTCIRGNGPQNLQTLFLTPDGEIFHVVSGFVAPEDLVEELGFAKNLFEELKKDSSRSSASNSESIVIDSHRQRLANFGFAADQIDSRGLFPGGMSMPDMQAMMNQAGQMTRGNLQLVAGQGGSVFDSMIRRQVLTDHQFCMQHPLMASETFERDPTPLVGNGKSFFSSSSSGN